MKTIISGRNIQLTDAIKSTVAEKIHKINEHYDFVREVHVFLSVEKNPRIADSQKAEATVHVNGATLRLEAGSEDLYASIDMLVDKMDRALQRYKTKLLQRNKAGHSAGGESIRHIGDLEDKLKDPALHEASDAQDDEDNFDFSDAGGVWIVGETVDVPAPALKTGTR